LNEAEQVVESLLDDVANDCTVDRLISVNQHIPEAGHGFHRRSQLADDPPGAREQVE
jgi:hypothetical protein